MACLTDKYRPANLSQVVGQPIAVNILKAYAHSPHPRAFLLHGETGTGKTSAALALAAELGCMVAQQEFGGLHVIPAGEQTADAVRRLVELLCLTPFYGSGWRVAVVNECDVMSAQAQAVWLDVLEKLPPRCAVVFTTNDASKLPRRFRDRCCCLEFHSKGTAAVLAAQSLADRIWKAEGRTDARPPLSVGADEISYRAILNLLELHLAIPEKRAEAPAPASSITDRPTMPRPATFALTAIIAPPDSFATPSAVQALASAGIPAGFALPVLADGTLADTDTSILEALWELAAARRLPAAWSRDDDYQIPCRIVSRSESVPLAA